MDSAKLSRGWQYVRVGVFVVAVVVLVEGSTVRGDGVGQDGQIEFLERRSTDTQPWHVWVGHVLGRQGGEGGCGCKENWGMIPCSVTLGGNAVLLVAFGFMLLKSAQCLSKGSDMLLSILGPGVVGGLVLPILGAIPDILIIIVSGLGARQADAQKEVLVGMGLVAGSSVLVLTALWGSCLIVGRCDLEEHDHQLVAKDKTLTKGFSLTKTGVTNDHQTMQMSWIMMATLLPFLVAQTPRLLGLHTPGNFFIAIAAVIAMLGLFAFCIYQLVAAPWIQNKRIELAMGRYRINHALHRMLSLGHEQNWGSLFTPTGKPNTETLRRLFDHFDSDHDKLLTETALKGLILGLGIERHNGQVPDEDELKHWMKEFDVSGDDQISIEEFLAGIDRWAEASRGTFKRAKSAPIMLGTYAPASAEPFDFEALVTRHARMAQRDLIDLQNEANEDEEDKLKEPPSRTQIIGRAVAYLVVGVAIAIIFADPLVGAIGGFAKASALSPFFVSFVATSLATSSSEAVSSVIFAKRKRKRNISMTYSLIYGAVIMKNTMCLGIFLAVVYFRQLVWDFSAEVAVILFATVVMGTVAAARTTFPLWMAFIALALYPLSIALIAFLDYFCGWH